MDITAGNQTVKGPRPSELGRQVHLGSGHYIMAVVVIVLGFFLIWPAFLILINSFNVARDWLADDRVWGLSNWVAAWQTPGVFSSLVNSVLVWVSVVGISMPIAIIIAWVLARTDIPFSRPFEFLFWLSYMMPNLSTTISWIMLGDPYIGFINVWLKSLGLTSESLFNIYSFEGIVWAHLMGNGISLKVMLLTPAFRNMDAAMEEAARVSGGNNIFTMMRVTLPLMITPIALVFALQLLRMFQSFEVELLLGTPIKFFVYSTKIYEFMRMTDPPNYGLATSLASATLFLVAIIIPVQRWILARKRYTTLTGSFKPGLIKLGFWKWPLFGTVGFLHILLTIGPVVFLLLGSFMVRAGFFSLDPLFTLRHWIFVFNDEAFLRALRTTLMIALISAVVSPLIFSVIAYLLVRTRLPGRVLLDLVIWGSGALPGILSGLGLLWLFLSTPGLNFMYGTIYALILVVVLQGNTTGVNILKGVFVQVGADMEEAARVSGAGWIRTYFFIWIPMLMPTLVLLSMISFTIASGTTSPIIFLASRETTTLSLLALEYASPGMGLREKASIVGLIMMMLTTGLAALAYKFGIKMNVRHDMKL